MNFSKNQIINFLGILVVIIILVGVLRVAFWELNIFKKETNLPTDVLKIKQEIDALENFKISEISVKINEALPPAKTLEIPQINQSEIGKKNIFE